MLPFCHIPPLALRRELSTDTMYGSTIFSSTKSRPITSILGLRSSSLPSEEMFLSLLSNVLLSGTLPSRPHTAIILALYGLPSESRKNECNALLLGILSHILTMKHLSITVGE